MTDPERVLVRLARLVARELDQPLVHRLSMACREILAVDGAAIVLGYGAAPRQLTYSTDERAARLEDLHDILGEGPAVDAYRHGRIVTGVLRSGKTRPWPLFIPAALDVLGVAAIHAVPIRSADQVVGVLTLHQLGEHRAPPDPTDAQFLADAVGAAVLADPSSYGDARAGSGDQGSETWHRQAVIDQATGMVMAQLGVAAEDAVALLRAHAFAHSRSLLDIATRTLSRELNFTGTIESGDVE
jgi:GAF domain-containing protein